MLFPYKASRRGLTVTVHVCTTTYTEGTLTIFFALSMSTFLQVYNKAQFLK